MRILTSEPVRAAAAGDNLSGVVKARVLAEGFDTVGIADPAAIGGAGEGLIGFLAAGFHGDMGWLEANADKRADPRVLWPEVRSVILVTLNYGPDDDPRPARADASRGAVSVYAKGADYHDIIKAKLKAVARDFADMAGEDVKVFVDTAPVMEKPLAQAAGLGWQGKHTNLVSRDLGSWFFLGAIFTTARLAPDTPERDRCGTCCACLDACPTRAFPEPHRIDARRCISYLTIEHKGQIGPEFREAIGNRIYGCDECLAACPWNKFAQKASEVRFHARDAADNPPLHELLRLDAAAFRARFAGSPVKRIKRDRFVRNALVAAGNSGDQALLDDALRLICDDSPLVRGMAVWAVSRLGGLELKSKLKERYSSEEKDATVREEWERMP
ncbi:tRNA epoxyqueuosine(34) reductase QueG [Rhodomicrobium lacus]|uniref:tRNA epoxyqueuosine(34) reductase QueG n=1 Tax=Rhodomicrobium lacus TaxID=2498452 RepID=UPI0026E34124|nr:tRNA epoxyqueuosine(34) reductase QueG [Rhodomicrobium lacus]WKW51790.1 tRNA epoxyqueuosine(34) reductase QueG [Rhodomicrobium lacus]